ncbi:MAG: N-acetylglucosamine-6-phosphate deacetylase [Alphaproteobacteria bacterium]|nr:MAG: N-acetylglucosamine-6-phosphate deacetylase [Alphaproteobacteria bacterium]
MKALINARVLTPEGFKDNQSVLFRDGLIVTVCDDIACPADITVERDLRGMTLLPGFIDTQVNGGGGVLFNDSSTVEGIKAIGEAHRKFGTTGFLPTLISDNPDIMARAIEAVEMAIAQGVPGVLGIHLEGPFLNEQKRGVHDASKFREIGEDELNLLSSLKGGKTIVTLAPEKTTADIILALHRRGVIVSAGHSLASYEETLTALDAGLTGFTHLFNAMTPLNSRHPGIIAAALQDPRGWCGIIADGHHVHPAMLRLAVRAKADDQIFLVTDSMPSVGAKDKPFFLGNIRIEVADGKCVTADGTLAGSDLDMISAVRNAMDFLDIDLEQATRMASILPARFIMMQDQLGELRAGLQADFILLSPELEVMESWIRGQATS